MSQRHFGAACASGSKGPPAGADAAVHEEPETQAKYTFSCSTRVFEEMLMSRKLNSGA